jgi:hypothetical protein
VAVVEIIDYSDFKGGMVINGSKEKLFVGFHIYSESVVNDYSPVSADETALLPSSLQTQWHTKRHDKKPELEA